MGVPLRAKHYSRCLIDLPCCEHWTIGPEQSRTLGHRCAALRQQRSHVCIPGVQHPVDVVSTGMAYCSGITTRAAGKAGHFLKALHGEAPVFHAFFLWGLLQLADVDFCVFYVVTHTFSADLRAPDSHWLDSCAGVVRCWTGMTVFCWPTSASLC